MASTTTRRPPSVYMAHRDPVSGSISIWFLDRDTKRPALQPLDRMPDLEGNAKLLFGTMSVDDDGRVRFDRDDGELV